jgi:hypothetical protein
MSIQSAVEESVPALEASKSRFDEVRAAYTKALSKSCSSTSMFANGSKGVRAFAWETWFGGKSGAEYNLLLLITRMAVSRLEDMA